MTIQKITMPQLGESVTEGTLERWLVKPGDKVNKYDPLAEVITDKVNAEIPSSFSGTIRELVAVEGETYPVGSVVCTIETNDANVARDPETKSNISSAILNAGVQRKEDPQKLAEKSSEPIVQQNKARYSPAVLTLAREHHINLELVNGSGLGGRITRKDIQAIIASGKMPTQDQEKPNVNGLHVEQQASQQSVQQEITKDTTTFAAGDIEIPVSPVRRAIANNMLRSKHEIPHAWMMIEVDVTNLVAYRDSIKDEFKKREGFNITYFSFFMKAVAQALKEYPMMNSMWAGDQIVQKKDINLSIAVATDDALFVPVVKHVDEKSIKGIARDIHELTQLVRSGKLRSEHMQGGTFTVNNTGSFGSIQSMGIINYPQAAILQVEAIVKRPVIMNGGMFAARDMVNLCLSLDHRVLDGLICSKFLNRVKDILENTSLDTMSVY